MSDKFNPKFTEWETYDRDDFIFRCRCLLATTDKQKDPQTYNALESWIAQAEAHPEGTPVSFARDERNYTHPSFLVGTLTVSVDKEAESGPTIQ